MDESYRHAIDLQTQGEVASWNCRKRFTEIKEIG
jgi:hypothetical protein